MAHNGVKTTQKSPGGSIQPFGVKYFTKNRLVDGGSKRLKTTAWASQHWPDRVRLILSMMSPLPNETLTRLRAVLGDGMAVLNRREVQAGAPDTTPGDSRRSGTTPVIEDQAPDVTPEQDLALLAIAEPARTQKRLGPDEMRPLIRSFCRGRFLTFRQLATLLSREPNGLQRWTLRPMAQEKQLVLAYPDTPNHPKQAYQTNPDWRER